MKVDRAFISSIRTRTRSRGILRGTESLCSALNIAMVAEGVEIQEDLAYLRAPTQGRCPRCRKNDELQPLPVLHGEAHEAFSGLDVQRSRVLRNSCHRFGKGLRQ